MVGIGCTMSGKGTAADEEAEGPWLRVGSGVADLEVPRNAVAVEVEVSAALRVLNAGGPVVLLRQAAWFSSLCGIFETGFGGGGVRLREIDQDLRPLSRDSFELPLLSFDGEGLGNRCREDVDDN